MLPKSIPDVFLDTDVAFDIISKREPHHAQAVMLLELASQNKIHLALSESSLATLFYLSFDIYKIQHASEKLIDFIQSCTLIHAGKTACIKALESKFKDKEDALQYFTATHAESDYFITRNLKDYKKFEQVHLPVYSPETFIKLIE